MKVARMMIKIAVLTVTVTVIDSLSLLFCTPSQFSPLPFLHILVCTCETGMTDMRCIVFNFFNFFFLQLFFPARGYIGERII